MGISTDKCSFEIVCEYHLHRFGVRYRIQSMIKLTRKFHNQTPLQSFARSLTVPFSPKLCLPSQPLTNFNLFSLSFHFVLSHTTSEAFIYAVHTSTEKGREVKLAECEILAKSTGALTSPVCAGFCQIFLFRARYLINLFVFIAILALTTSRRI